MQLELSPGNLGSNAFMHGCGIVLWESNMTVLCVYIVQNSNVHTCTYVLSTLVT